VNEVERLVVADHSKKFENQVHMAALHARWYNFAGVNTDIVKLIEDPVRKHLRRNLIVMPLLLAGLNACMTLGAVPNDDAAIAIFKKTCPRSSRGDFGPYSRWDAQLVGNSWHVHAKSEITYRGIVPRWVDTYLDIPKDGSPPGRCLEQVTE
jgi:hypothetical protein